MAATSVTGVGRGSGDSEHYYLGVSKLIGPRWTEEHEKKYEELVGQHNLNKTVIPNMGRQIINLKLAFLILILTQIMTFITLGMFVSLR